MSSSVLSQTAGPAYAPPSQRDVASPPRITSLDVVRGVVVVLMAIDHVRVYSGQPAGGPTPGIFFTRWITHFVAPAFLFLAGTGAYLYGQRVRDRGKLSRFLFTRGLWLVLLELTVIRVAWTFNFDFAHYMLAGVIWMIGWCMVLMAGLVYLPYAAIATLGVGIIALHNLTDYTPAFISAMEKSALAPVWQILYTGGAIQLGDNGPPLVILFVLVPWIGVMAAGYAYGRVMTLEPERRRRISIWLGLAVTVAFLVVRGIDAYGDPRAWHRAPAAMPAALAFLATNKYPASLSFLLLTLGPMLVLIGLVEHARGPIARALETFGRVPFFYYLLHIPVIHLAAVVVSFIREGKADPWLFANHPVMPGPAPRGYQWSLPLLYLVWAIVIGVLYIACRWFAGVKERSGSPLLKYL
jgi:uncharacterized membrane protein